MSKEMRKLIDDFNTFNNKKLNEGFFDDQITTKLCSKLSYTPCYV